MYILIALIAYVLLAVVLLLDKKILTQNRTSPAVFTFYSTVFLLGVGVVWFFGVPLLSGWFDWGIALVSGITFGLGLWWMYQAVGQGEASHLDPFIGAIITVATFAIAGLWIGEVLVGRQIIGIAVLVLASLLLSFKKKQSGFKLEHGLWWAMAAGVAFAISNVTAKYLYNAYEFLPAFAATRFTIGIFGLMLLPLPVVIRSFGNKKEQKKPSGQGPGWKYILVDKVLGVIGAVLVQVAIAGGSVTIVNALSGLQYGFMFVLIVLLSKFKPRLFKESFDRSELAVQTAAIILIIAGLGLVVL